MKYQVKGLTCANCAMKIEEEIKHLPGIENAKVNVWQELLEVEGTVGDEEDFFSTVKRIVTRREPHVQVLRLEPAAGDVALHGAMGDHACCCGHDHAHTHDHTHTHDHAHEHDHDHEHDHPHAHAHHEAGPVNWGWFVAGLVLFGASYLVSGTARLGVFILAFAAIAHPVLREAVEKLLHGDALDESFLMTVASVGAIIIGQREEGLAVMALYLVGEYLEFLAVGRARHSLQELLAYQPDEARVWHDNGWVIQPAKSLHTGMLVQVLPGEKVPADGIIQTGQSFVNTAHLTGESVPQSKEQGDVVLAGTIVQDGVITVGITEDYDHSAVAKMLHMMEEAGEHKAKSERFVTRFAKVFTPAVLGLAVLIAVGVPVLTGEPWMKWVYRALTFLVISCPCALVLSIPLAYFAGIGAASKQGILVKGSQFVDDLAGIDTIVFDKTGTLTTGDFHLVEIHPETGMSEEALLALAAQGEQTSTHPLARAVLEAYKGPLQQVEHGESLPGRGLRFTLDGVRFTLGNEKLMVSMGIQVPAVGEGAVIHLAGDERYLGYLRLEDRLKADAADGVAYYRQRGIDTVLLSGDHPAVAKRVGEALAMETVKGGLLPEEKFQWIESAVSSGKKVAYVGDGINDGPAMAKSTVGLAMGTIGSAGTVEVADMVIMRDEMSAVARAHVLAKRIVSVVRCNVVFILGVKALFLLLGALGLANIWMAVFADVGVAVLSVLNAARLMAERR